MVLDETRGLSVVVVCRWVCLLSLDAERLGRQERIPYCSLDGENLWHSTEIMNLCIGLILLIPRASLSIDPNAMPVQLLAWYDVPPKASRDVRVVLRVYVQRAMHMVKESAVGLVTPQLFSSKDVLEGGTEAPGVIGDDILILQGVLPRYAGQGVID